MTLVLAVGINTACSQETLLDIHGDSLPQHAVGRLGSTRFLTRGGSVTQVSWSPNGKFLASASSNIFNGSFAYGIQIWAPASGRMIGPEQLAYSNANAMAWSPDSRHCAVGFESGSIEIWDVASNRRTRESTDTGSTVSCIDWSSNGKWIAAGSKNGILKVLDAESGELVKSFEQPATDLDFSDDSAWLATCHHDKHVSVWDISSGKLEYEVNLAPTPSEHDLANVLSIEIAPDRQSLVIAANRTSVVDLSETEPRVSVLKDQDGKAVASFTATYSPDGSQIATAGITPPRRWDAKDQSLLHEYKGYPGFVAAYSPDGKSLALQARRLVIVDLETNASRHPESGNVRTLLGITISADGLSAFTFGTSSTIHRWDTESARQTGTLNLPFGTALDASVSPNGKLVAVAAEDRLYFFDSVTGELSGKPLKERGTVTSVTYSSNGAILVSRSSDGTIRFLDPVKRESIGTMNLKLQGSPLGYSIFTPDAEHIAFVSPSKSQITIFSLRTRKRLRNIKFESTARPFLLPACFLPDNKSLVLAVGHPKKQSQDQIQFDVEIQDLSTGRRVRLLEGQLNQPTAIACTAQGDLIAVADHLDPKTTTPELIIVYSAITGKRVAEFPGHQDFIRRLAFSPDSSRLYSASQDTTVLIWAMTETRSNHSLP